MKRKSRLADGEHSIDKKRSIDLAQMPQPHILLFTHKLCDQVPLTTGLWLMQILMGKEVKKKWGIPILWGEFLAVAASSFRISASWRPSAWPQVLSPSLGFTSSRELFYSQQSLRLQTPSPYYVAIPCLVPWRLYNLYYQIARLKYSKRFIFLTLTSVFDHDWSVPLHVRLWILWFGQEFLLHEVVLG